MFTACQTCEILCVWIVIRRTGNYTYSFWILRKLLLLLNIYMIISFWNISSISTGLILNTIIISCSVYIPERSIIIELFRNKLFLITKIFFSHLDFVFVLIYLKSILVTLVRKFKHFTGMLRATAWDSYGFVTSI